MSKESIDTIRSEYSETLPLWSRICDLIVSTGSREEVKIPEEWKVELE